MAGVSDCDTLGFAVLGAGADERMAILSAEESDRLWRASAKATREGGDVAACTSRNQLLPPRSRHDAVFDAIDAGLIVPQMQAGIR